MKTLYRVLKQIAVDGVVYVPADTERRYTGLAENRTGFIELTDDQAAKFIKGEIGPTSIPAEEKG